MKPRVLVTRPEPGAQRTAGRLRQAGFEPVTLPLTRFDPQEFTLPHGPFDGVIATSAQALAPAEYGPLLRLPLYAVGGTTAEAARLAGFADVRTADGSAESVAALVENSVKLPSRLLYLCGRVRRPELEEALEQAGRRVAAVETYDAVPVAYTQDALAGRLGQTPIDVVTLMSAQAAKLFSALARGAGLEHVFTDSAIVCLSARIADALAAQDVWRICVTGEASEDSMLKLLSEKFLAGRSEGCAPDAP